jgi:hypothetical protein
MATKIFKSANDEAAMRLRQAQPESGNGILTQAHENVAQSFTLPYRRFAIGHAFKGRKRWGFHALQNLILRYGRLKICATVEMSRSKLYHYPELCRHIYDMRFTGERPKARQS